MKRALKLKGNIKCIQTNGFIYRAIIDGMIFFIIWLGFYQASEVDDDEVPLMTKKFRTLPRFVTLVSFSIAP